MKKLIFALVVIPLLSFTDADSPLSKKERDFATDQLTSSKNHLMSAIKGLSEAQLNFKATPDSWSIAECTEHIAIAEGIFDEMIAGVLKQPADPSKRSEVKMTDEQILAMITDRSNKVKTSEPFEPTGKFGSHEGTVKEFTAKRESRVAYVKTTNDDLRNRYQQMRFGTIDAYQVILFMAGHSERHTRQIEEVKANPEFPKK